MTVRTTLARLSLATALAAPLALAGCSNDANTQEAQTAEKATGITPDNATTKTVTEQHKVVVEKDVKVKDAVTGQVLSETKESTPVTIVKEEKKTTNVKVDVGDTKSSGAPPAK